MKKVLLLIISVLSVIHAYAQNVDSLQPQSASITIDSLSLKLEKLQNDYNYLSCDFELYRVQMELNKLSQDANIKTNGVLIDIYNSRYDRELYDAYTKNYDSCCALFDSVKDKYEKIKTLVILRMATSDFSDTQHNVLMANFDTINQSVTAVDTALKYYNYVINAYRKNRF